MNISIAVPTNRGIQPKMLESLLELLAVTEHQINIIVAEEGYTIAENRNYCAIQALNAKSDFLLFVDDDMTFEPGTLDKLVANNKDICGVAYHPRCGADRLKWLDETHHINLETNNDPKYKDVFECHATGTGIVLIKCDILYKIPRPWFMFDYFDDPDDPNAGQTKKGEDWWFCEKAKDHGFKTWTDPTIKVGHLGEKIY